MARDTLLEVAPMRFARLAALLLLRLFEIGEAERLDAAGHDGHQLPLQTRDPVDTAVGQLELDRVKREKPKRDSTFA